MSPRPFIRAVPAAEPSVASPLPIDLYLIGADAIGEALGVSRYAVYQRAKRGQLPVARWNGQIVARRADLVAIIEAAFAAPTHVAATAPETPRRGRGRPRKVRV